MPKNKPNKGLLKRIRITASGRVKHGRAFARHRRSHKSGKLLRSYGRSAYAHATDIRRIACMLHRRITAGSKKRTNCDRCCTDEPTKTTPSVEAATETTAPVETKAAVEATKTDEK